MNPDDYAGADGMQQLFHNCLRAAGDGDIEALSQLLSVKAGRTYEKHEVPRVAAAAMLVLGENGVDALGELVHTAPGAILPQAAFNALWLAASDQPVLQSSLGLSYPDLEINPVTRDRARHLVDDLIIEAQVNEDILTTLLNLEVMEMPSPFGGSSRLSRPSLRSHTMEVIRESAIVLTSRLIDEFARLVDLPELEGVYQAFLEAHPVFLDPLAAEIFNRQRLGDELVTDFVIRRHDGRYVVVEIEKPRDFIFTGKDDFTANFTHASGQVLDFQGWVAENAAYAQRRLPLIENPAGLLIMGRRSDLSEPQQARLRRWCANSKNIEVVTFDDLVMRARALHRSLRRATGSKV